MTTKRLFYTLFLLAALWLGGSRSASAQIFISEDMFTGQQSRLRIKLLDSLTREPIPFASVYLKAKGDTTISHFNLTDKEGVGEIEEIPYGGYRVNAEILGYKPWRKEVYFRSGYVNLGTVLMQEDTEMLEAAQVTAAGNAVEVKQDTLIYNASAFHSSDSDMLGDLLKKMPGIEVDKSGNVTVNGEKVDKITVNGKTFFFDDPTMAVKNLPAKVVEQVKVIDKKSEAEETTGIVEQDKEKVMDLSLKKEYKKGWFGNAKAAGGAPLMPDTKKNELIDDRDFLYNLSTLIAGYNEKDQLTVMAGSMNVPGPDDDGAVVIYSEDGEIPLQGLNTTHSLGINLNTDRIKGMESSGMVIGKADRMLARNRTSRTTFQHDAGDLFNQSAQDAVQQTNVFRTNFEFKNKKREKYTFNFAPYFRMDRTRSDSERSSEVSKADGALNDSRGSRSSVSDIRNIGATLNFGIKNLGKEMRSLNLGGSFGLNGSEGSRNDLTTLRNRVAGTEEVRNLWYTTKGGGHNFSGSLEYTEPLAKAWALQWRLQGRYSFSRSDKPAFDDAARSTANPYYSSVSENRYLSGNARMLLQWSKDKTSLQAGASLLNTRNETHSESFGIKTDVGKGEWLLDWAPFVNFRTAWKDATLDLRYDGYSSQPGNQRMLPVLDISDPSRISTGNIYLKPMFRHYFNGSWRYNNKQNFSYLGLYFYGSLNQRGIVSASWFDPAGVQYAVPVNACKPGLSLSLYPNLYIPLDKERVWSVSANVSETFNRSFSYQNVSTREGLDAASFDYATFMQDFWGGPDGERFYGGQSGFAESLTCTNTANLRLSLALGLKTVHLTVGGTSQTGYTHYTLNPRADRTTWNHSAFLWGSWQAPKNFELKTDFSYNFYRGYAAGYNEPEAQLSLTLNKNVKAFTFSFFVNDLLNQTRNRYHNATDNYTEDTYRNILGRYFLVGLKWNFGKMNQAQSQRVQDASWQMLMP